MKKYTFMAKNIMVKTSLTRPSWHSSTEGYYIIPEGYLSTVLVMWTMVGDGWNFALLHVALMPLGAVLTVHT